MREADVGSQSAYTIKISFSSCFNFWKRRSVPSICKNPSWIAPLLAVPAGVIPVLEGSEHVRKVIRREVGELHAAHRARVKWLISPKARGMSHLNCHGESETTQGRPKHFRTSERPRNSQKRNWSTRQMSALARSTLICRKGRSPQRKYLNGSKNRAE
jgi:hypothetical protein